VGAKARAKARARASPPVEHASPRRQWRAPVALFIVALLVRILFWQATPDRSWPYSAWYKGDAPVWMDYGQALRTNRTFELGLPIHPPAAGYLVATLWNGEASGVSWLRFCWALMGTLLVSLVFLAVRRPFGFRTAAIAAYLCAISSGLILLGSAVNNEVPYLLLVMGALALWEPVRDGTDAMRLVAFAALNGIACLFRVEHVLTFAMLLALAALAWRRAGPVRLGKRLGVALVGFVVPMIPWQLAAWHGIEQFNEGPRTFDRAEGAAIGQVELALAGMRWQPGAERRRDELPAFLRRPTSVFVAATVAYRGGREVREEDFDILDQAFGYVPHPLARHPFVSSYGPLNFYLANRPGARGGFDRSPLNEPPRLAGGIDRYPRFLVQGLPPPDLSFTYPPHLRLFNEGYRLGWQAIRERPMDWIALGARKLWIFWSGASLGVTGFNLPLGLSGVRRAVDLVVPEGPLAVSWGVLVLAVCALGVLAGRGLAGLAPWLAFVASKVLVTVLFFGYARQGAMLVPVIALLAALAMERWVLPRAPKTLERHVLVAALLLAPVVVESVRYIAQPAVTVDGQAVGPVDPFPPHEHRDQAVRVGHAP